jgi:hypothetical protein
VVAIAAVDSGSTVLHGFTTEAKCHANGADRLTNETRRSDVETRPEVGRRSGGRLTDDG